MRPPKNSRTEPAEGHHPRRLIIGISGASGIIYGVRALELSQLVWPPLPGTGKEASAVAKTMPGFTVYVGAEATETAVKAVHSPKILHIATHGFFLPDPPPPPSARCSCS